MKVSELRGILNNLPWDADVTIQLPDNEPPLDFVLEFYRKDGTVESFKPSPFSVEYLSDESLVVFPVPPVEGAVWDHDNNVITWYSLDSVADRLEGEG
jgi:hypothetical protein